MEDTPIPEDEVSAASQNKGCISCNHPIVLEGYPNRFCEECRNKHIKFPIPRWVKAFGGGIALLVLFSFYYLPSNFVLGLHLEKGIKAEKENKYQTAENELKKVVAKVPANIEANAYLFIASFYNQDIETMVSTSQVLSGKKMDDEELFERVDELMTAARKYFPSDSLAALHEKYSKANDSIPDAVYEKFIVDDSSDVNARVEYAGLMFDRGEFQKCDSLLEGILRQDQAFAPALILLASSKRYQKQPGPALVYIERLLSFNKENVFALSSKARAYLMLKKDKEAKQLAMDSYNLNEKDGFSLATLAIAYHYNNDIKERDKLVKKANESKDSITHGYFQYALDVISNKEKLRD